jgi:hypothetical protein
MEFADWDLRIGIYELKNKKGIWNRWNRKNGTTVVSYIYIVVSSEFNGIVI